MANVWVILGSWNYGDGPYLQDRQQWFTGWFDSYEAALLQADRWNRYFEQAHASDARMVELEAMVWRAFDSQLPQQQLDSSYTHPCYSVNRVTLKDS